MRSLPVVKNKLANTFSYKRSELIKQESKTSFSFLKVQICMGPIILDHIVTKHQVKLLPDTIPTKNKTRKH